MRWLVARVIRLAAMEMSSEGAPGNGTGPPSEGFVVQSWVCNRPVQVFPSKSLPSELAVVRDPTLSFIVLLSLDNGGLISKQFRRIFWEPGG